MPRLRSTIKTKLIVATLVPLSVAIAFCWLVGVFILNTRSVDQALAQVRNDLNAAREIYRNEIGHIRDVARFTAGAPYVIDAFARGNTPALATILPPLLTSEHLDVLTAVDATGRVLYRASNPGSKGDDLSGNLFVARALQGELVSGTSIFPPGETVVEGAELASQAAIPLVPTPRARLREDAVEQAGMFLVAAAPVRDRAGNLVGALFGGLLLNNNNHLVDRIRSIVFEAVHSGGEVGGATIFLSDLRIATNMQSADGRRAIGTRMSEEVYQRVILQRDRWVGRAFVVNDWYFAAYEPILSLEGVPIGALYVGLPEKPFVALKRQLGLLYSGVLLVGAACGLAVSWFVGARLARPIRSLENAARRVATGEQNVPLQIRTGDEIEELAHEFEAMTRTLVHREERIRELNRDLERKVEERTAELTEKHRQLLAAQEELARTGKLAAIGELAAGVAHEINNPLAIIRGNTELLQMAIPPAAESREEVDTIYQQVGRVERIVANLLRFARQERRQLGNVTVNELLAEILRQVGHQIPLTGITVQESYADDLPDIDGDGDHLRQVFTNLVLNGLQAMPAGGTLTVVTAADPLAGTCRVEVADTGCGIDPEQLEQIFNPFFTTKKGGSGLGLAVSYGIVKEHGGTIQVESEPGVGSRFRVVLPLHQGGGTGA